MSFPPDQLDPTRGATAETFQGIPIEELTPTQRHNYLVSREESILPLARAALLRPVVATELYTAQTDRVAAGNGEYYATKRLRQGMETVIRHRGAELTLPQADELSAEMLDLVEKKSGLEPHDTWVAYAAAAVELDNNPELYWDGLLDRVSSGECRPSELQLVLDIFHPGRKKLALIAPHNELMRRLAGQVYEVPPIGSLPKQYNMKRAEKTISRFAVQKYPRNSRTNNPYYAQIIAEAKLHQERGLIPPDSGEEEEALCNPHNIARDERLLGTVTFLTEGVIRSYPKEIRDTLEEATERRHLRAVKLEKEGSPLVRVGKVLVKTAFGVRSIK